MNKRLYLIIMLFPIILYSYPYFNKIEDKSFFEGDTISFIVEAYSWQNNPLQFTLENGPEGAELQYLGRIGGCLCSKTIWGARFELIADYKSSGEYQITFTVKDMNNRTDSDTVLLSIIDVPYPPSISLIPDTSIIENDTLRLDLNIYVTDLDNQTDELLWDAFGYKLLYINIDESNTAEIFAPQGINGIDTVYFTVKDPSNLSDTADVQIAIENATSVHRLFNLPNQNLRVYPNPFSEQIYINFSNDKKYTIRIYNILGQLVFSSEVQNNSLFSWAPNKQHSNYLQSGIYFIHVLTENAKFIRRITYLK